jgi:hypothetical protein
VFIPKGLKVLCFGSVHSKGLAEPFFVSVHSRVVTGILGKAEKVGVRREGGGKRRAKHEA